MQIRQANLIPQEFIRSQEYVEICQKIKRVLISIIFASLLFTSLIMGMYYYLETNQDMDVPVEIKNEYLAAQKNNALLQKKKEYFLKAENEDCLPMDMLYALLNDKPDSIKFTRLEIADVIMVEGFGVDPAAFNEYVSRINENKEFFSQAVVERISSAANQELKTFSIKIARTKT